MKKRFSIFLSYPYSPSFLFYHHSHLGYSKNCIFLGSFSVRKLSSFVSTPSARPFPDYSPKTPTIQDSQLVYHITTAIKQRRSEPLPRILKPFESKFRAQHLIWVLTNIKHNYNLVLDFFEWWRLRRGPSLEARCIVAQISAAAKDLEMARWLFHDFWTKPNLDVGVAFPQFVEKLVYTYKYWGSNPVVFDVFFQVLVEVGKFKEARAFFDKMLNYGLVISVDSCNLFHERLSNNVDALETTMKVFAELSEVGICWNTASYNIVIHFLCRVGKVKEAHSLLLQMEFRGSTPDVVSYSSVIDGYCNSGDLQMVLKIIDEMQSKRLNPNSFTFNSVILLLCKTGKLVDAERVLREMINQGVIPDNVVYTTLIDGFCKLGNVWAGYRLFDEMRSRNIFPDLIAYTALICGICQAQSYLILSYTSRTAYWYLRTQTRYSSVPVL